MDKVRQNNRVDALPVHLPKLLKYLCDCFIYIFNSITLFLRNIKLPEITLFILVFEAWYKRIFKPTTNK